MRQRRDIGKLIASLPGPDEIGSQRRAWHVVRAAFAEREPVRWPRRHARPLVALAVAGAILAGALTPPGRAVIDYAREVIGEERVVGVSRSQQALFSFPGSGRLLVVSRRGAWIVQAGKAPTRRLLGRYRTASWSPRARFVVVTRGQELSAVDPRGNLRWALPRLGTLTAARWAPGDGFRIAYLSDEDLRVVVGDGTGDRLFRRGVPPAVFTAIAWRPRAQHVLSSGDRLGRVKTYAVDRGSQLWQSRRTGEAATKLEWSGDGRVLLALDRTSIRLFGPGGRLLRRTRVPGTAVDAAFKPGTHVVAIVYRRGGRSTVSVLSGARFRERRLFAGPGRLTDLAWSPGGRWLMVGWRSADQWLFLDPLRPQRLRAVSNVSRQFTPGGRPLTDFPDVADAGWCCP